MKLNKTWHAENPMPKRASLEQRIAWHVEHERHCACRAMPDSIRKAIAERGRKP